MLPMPMVSNFNNVLYILPCTCPLPYLFCTSFNYRKFTMHTVHIHFFILFSIIHSFGSSTECQLWHTILETALIPFRSIFTASVLMVFTHKEKKTTHTKLPNGKNTRKTIRCNCIHIQFAYRQKNYLEFIYYKICQRLPWKWHANAGISTSINGYFDFQKLPHTFSQVDMPWTARWQCQWRWYDWVVCICLKSLNRVSKHIK